MKNSILTFVAILLMAPQAFGQKVVHTERYAQDNQGLLSRADIGHRVVLMGDSITDFWPKRSPGIFVEHPNLVDRGISGEVTAQMLLRFQPDVIDLHPETVVILAGINDIAQNLGDTYNEDNTFNNIKSMTELARAHDIRVVLCALLPSVRCRWRPEIEDVPEKVASLNVRLRTYAKENCIPFADYYSALAGEDGKTIRGEYSPDTVHPNPAGYAIMENILLNILDAQPQSFTVNLYPDGPAEQNGLAGQETSRDDGFVRNTSDATLTCYLPARSNGKMVVICPGGGYSGLAMRHEGANVAEWFMEHGFAACVLKYRMPNGHHTIPLSDVQAAFRYCRAHAAEWGIGKIGIMGFSAGGHLAATASNFYADAGTRPDFSILFYPVITLEEGVTHKGTRDHLLGKKVNDKELLAHYSLENQVTENTPPTYIALTATDKAVPPENSYRYYRALMRCIVPVQMQVYPEGPHGFGFIIKDDEKDILKKAYREALYRDLECWLNQL